MQLRWYQQEAIDKTYEYMNINTESNPCIVMPTGAGKTIVIATICADVAGKWGGRVLVLAHVKELLEQAAKHLQEFLDPGMVGIYSAGLKSRDTTHPVICAGIQSVYKRAGELGPFTAIIVDEADLIPTRDSGMYRQFLDVAKIVNPKVRIIGLTATPYRLDAGYICGQENILNDIAFEVGIKELIVQGYLCPIRTKAGSEHPDLSGVHIRGGEFIETEMAECMDQLVAEACKEVAELTKDRHSVLIFSSSVKHGQHVMEELKTHCFCHEEVGFLCGDTPSKERAQLLEDFKAQRLKYLVNVNVLTVGFDAPCIDAIVLLRATLSPRLYYQMVGRGLRTDESKEDCIVIDYGENAVRHGPVDAIVVKTPGSGDGDAPAKECPTCHAIVFAGVAMCPECGFEFPPPELKHDRKAGKAGVLSGEVMTDVRKVLRVSYFAHTKRKDPDAPKTMRVEYEISALGQKTRKEWVCFSHDGFARQRAEDWWRARSDFPVPATTEDAIKLANMGALVETTEVTWTQISGEQYGNITAYEIGDVKPTMEDLKSSLNTDEWDDVAPDAVAAVAAVPDWWDEMNDSIPF